MYYTTSDKKLLAFNSLSCALAVVDDTYTEILSMLPYVDEEILSEELYATYQAAVEGGFLIADDFDELIYFKMKRNIQKYSVSSLGLTIAPTLACNFKCVYCYETSKPGKMSVETQNSIFDIVKSQASALSHLDITWYGGEPLLAVDIITNMSEQFMKISEENGIEYSAYMISNGALLTDDIISKMIQYKIKGIQITVDGPKEIHDSRRISKDGGSSFNVIINNINKLLERKIDVSIRINVDKTNESELNSLLAYLEKTLVSHEIKITFGQVTAYTEACCSIESSCYNNGEFAKQLLDYYQLLRKYGFGMSNPFPYPTSKYNYCCAELMNSYVVDHEGYLYKCWNEIGNSVHAVGNVNEKVFDLANDKNGIWILNDSFESEKCNSCNLLPLCVGGCPYNVMRRKTESNCDLIKYNIEDVLQTYYDYAKEGLL